MTNDKYQPCGCGSGKKFKFCCYETGTNLSSAPEAELIRRAPELPVSRCVINSDWKRDGLASLLIIREITSRRYLVGSYLVDTFCLGLKDAVVHSRLLLAEVNDLIGGDFVSQEDIPYEDARSVILGAIEYARKLGFEPYSSWERARFIVDADRPFKKKYRFGKNGKAFYIAGPDDDVQAVMLKLTPLIEADKASFAAGTMESADLLDEIDELCDEAWDLIESEDYEVAKELIQDMLDEFPSHPQLPFLMGTCLGKQGDLDHAIPFFLQSISIEPRTETYHNLASAYHKKFQFEEFVQCLRKAIELDRSCPLGKRAESRLQDFASMISEQYGLTLEEFLHNKRQYEAAFDHLKDDRYEDAVRGFQEVLRIHPRHVQSHGNLGIAYACLGQIEKAIAHFDEAIKLDPHCQPAIENRRVVMKLCPGERLNGDELIDFYAEKAEAEPTSAEIR